MSLIAKNNEKHLVFIVFFAIRRVSESMSETSRAFGKAKLAPRLHLLEHLGNMLSWGQRAPRWRPRGPGGASMGGLEAPRREGRRGVEAKSAALGPYPHSKDPQILRLQASKLEDFNP